MLLKPFSYLEHTWDSFLTAQYILLFFYKTMFIEKSMHTIYIFEFPHRSFM